MILAGEFSRVVYRERLAGRTGYENVYRWPLTLYRDIAEVRTKLPRKRTAIGMKTSTTSDWPTV